MMHGNTTQQTAPAAVQDMPQMDSREVLIKLYASAIRNVEQAIALLDEGTVPPEELYCLGKAYWIMEYLIEALDFDLAPDLCADLQALYHNMMARMTTAYQDRTSAPLHAVVSALSDLKATWEEAIAISSGEAQAVHA